MNAFECAHSPRCNLLLSQMVECLLQTVLAPGLSSASNSLMVPVTTLATRVIECSTVKADLVDTLLFPQRQLHEPNVLFSWKVHLYVFMRSWHTRKNKLFV